MNKIPSAGVDQADRNNEVFFRTHLLKSRLCAQLLMQTLCAELFMQTLCVELFMRTLYSQLFIQTLCAELFIQTLFMQMLRLCSELRSKVYVATCSSQKRECL